NRPTRSVVARLPPGPSTTSTERPARAVVAAAAEPARPPPITTTPCCCAMSILLARTDEAAPPPVTADRDGPPPGRRRAGRREALALHPPGGRGPATSPAWRGPLGRLIARRRSRDCRTVSPSSSSALLGRPGMSLPAAAAALSRRLLYSATSPSVCSFISRWRTVGSAILPLRLARAVSALAEAPNSVPPPPPRRPPVATKSPARFSRSPAIVP